MAKHGLSSARFGNVGRFKKCSSIPALRRWTISITPICTGEMISLFNLGWDSTIPTLGFMGGAKSTSVPTSECMSRIIQSGSNSHVGGFILGETRVELFVGKRLEIS